MNNFYLIFIVSYILPIAATKIEISPQEVRPSTSTQPTIAYQQNALKNPADNIIENFEKIKISRKIYTIYYSTNECSRYYDRKFFPERN